MTRLFFCSPAMAFSTASWKSAISTALRPARTASRAASFTTLAKSAPAKPEVERATDARSTPLPSFTFLAWMRRIASRPFTSGRSTTTWRSKRPGRSRAGSRTSGRLVAARRISPLELSKPSISTKSWFRVCSRSSFPWILFTRLFPMASSSSMNTMQGAFSRAWRKRSRTRLAPTPTNISTKSEPEILKKGTPASPATALASRVFPVPGGPTKSTPLGIFPPMSVYFSGVLRKSTTSTSSSLASSTPATSAKRVVMEPSSTALALELPAEKMLPPRPPPILRKMNIHMRRMSPMGRSRFISNWVKNPFCFATTL